MYLRCLFLTTLAYSQPLAIVTTTVTAGEPSANDLIRLAPVITSLDDRFKRIDMSGFTKDDDGNTILRFRAIYRAPDRYALLLSDANETPLSFVSDHKLLVYNPVRPAILYADKDALCRIWISLEENIFNYHFDSIIDESKFSIIELDIRSMLTGTSIGDEVVKIGDTKYRLTRTSRSGNFYVFYVDTSLKYPYHRFDLVMKDTNRVRMCVEKIKIDEEVVEDREFTFPSKEQLVQKIAVKDLPGEGLLQLLVGMVSMSRAYHARMAATQPEFSNVITLYGFWKINWESVKTNDKKYSQMLKALIPCQPRLP